MANTTKYNSTQNRMLVSIVRKIKSRKWLHLLLAVIFLTAVTFSIGCGGDPPVAPEYEMLAWEFLDEFNRNPVEFETRYKNKWISIIGQILTIGEVNEVPVLDIGLDDNIYSIYAFFETNSSMLKNLSEDEIVRVVGRYSGQGFFNLQLHDCYLMD
jgi:hypothetical protein